MEKTLEQLQQENTYLKQENEKKESIYRVFICSSGCNIYGNIYDLSDLV